MQSLLNLTLLGYSVSVCLNHCCLDIGQLATYSIIHKVSNHCALLFGLYKNNDDKRDVEDRYFETLPSKIDSKTSRRAHAYKYKLVK